MDASDLLLLDAIISEGSITAAATKLGEPKATISRRLQRLERAAGAPLFDRTSRRLRPTPLGEGLSGPAAAIRVALAGAQSIADSSLKGEGGRLRIASPFLFGRLVLAPFVGKFLTGRPKTKVTLKFTNDIIDPMRDDFDLAIQITEPMAPYLVRTKLVSANLKLYAEAQIANAILRVSDLKNHPAIKTSNKDGDEMVLRLNDKDHSWEERLRVICTVNDPEAACFIAAEGQAIAALPEFLADRFVRMGSLMPVLPSVHAGVITIFAASPPGRLEVPLMRAFIKALKKELTDIRFAK